MAPFGGISENWQVIKLTISFPFPLGSTIPSAQSLEVVVGEI